ncbi:hypothetical protein BGZ59_008407 [Podila verticillata]|nr:hypothetical protein BGZ59_008407 [Podila verticillata]KAI9236890.1 MAG: hypothetical protein BYD32DRAFT_437075 [Podila humilis]KFH73345.1 hypothetical protein MVEG_00561 [Podila verticillata NRRL 6337]
MAQQRISWTSLLLAIVIFTTYTHLVVAQETNPGVSNGNYGPGTVDSPLVARPTLDQNTDPTLPPISGDPSPTQPTPTTTAEIQLPTLMYIPPTSSYINNDAVDPFYPVGSESCQKCRYFYPKLKECNQVANKTLSAIPPWTSDTPLSTEQNARAQFNFTNLQPFLQCICPDQGLAATKVCLTCFRVSNQKNFLNDLVLQNVTNSLSAFQEACLDSVNGTVVPPAGAKGQSAQAQTSLSTALQAVIPWLAIIFTLHMVHI